MRAQRLDMHIRGTLWPAGTSELNIRRHVDSNLGDSGMFQLLRTFEKVVIGTETYTGVQVKARKTP
jgi:hypothetical protein